jgi:hypothetical protein
MAGKYPNIWKWLPLTALGLMLVGDIAPVSDSMDSILLGVAIAILLSFSGAYIWQERRTAPRAGRLGTAGWLLSWTLPPVLAVGLLSLGTLTSIPDLLDKALSWVAFAILLVYVGAPMWEYHRERQAEQSSSAASTSSDPT